ncbi:regulatory LuxR family protein [Kribbella voronezhensis]|uniref:Regulatory LuxR family protein n=1 Tax=Kribbella voronezhensis TaxID=2512212 RepID=A0A4R7T613_9ACTN|nr:response regulator transcription factor [Kribbella voronezhensis]TDU87310.1 regulatory LuxR family protein [Kribbella voronezhensis]
MGIVDDLEQARKAFEQRDWATAYDQLAVVADLGPDDLLKLGTAAYLAGDDDACVRALQRGYQVAVDGGDTLRAVRFAFWLGLVLSVRGEVAVAGGWSARAQRLLADQPADVVERGYLLIHDFFRYLDQQDFPGAVRVAAEITELGRRHAEPDLLAQGLVCQGRTLMYAGQVPEGLALLDEAMVAVAAGELSPIFAGNVYCAMIEACQEVLDFGRASAWTTALTRWCDGQTGLVPFTGQCAVHRGQILRLRGEFAEALEEFERACRRYAASGVQSAAGFAMSEAGDVLRIRGAYPQAEDCYQQASGFGYEPQPGLALLWLARGRAPAAGAAVRRLLAETPGPVQRSRLLPAAVEVLVATGKSDEAEAAATELTRVAESFGCSGLRAMAAYCAALVAAAAGDADRALPQARQAKQLWSTLQAPYEVARAMVLVGRAFRSLGDEDSATAELAAALRIFSDVGAVAGRQEVEKLLGRNAPGGLTQRELEVLQLVAAGNSNTEIAQQLVLSDKTVARHLSNIFVKLDVPSRTAAVAYAREHDLL